jgi:hypothetical protein
MFSSGGIRIEEKKSFPSVVKQLRIQCRPMRLGHVLILPVSKFRSIEIIPSFCSKHENNLQKRLSHHLAKTTIFASLKC